MHAAPFAGCDIHHPGDLRRFRRGHDRQLDRHWDTTVEGEAGGASYPAGSPSPQGACTSAATGSSGIWFCSTFQSAFSCRHGSGTARRHGRCRRCWEPSRPSGIEHYCIHDSLLLVYIYRAVAVCSLLVYQRGCFGTLLHCTKGSADGLWILFLWYMRPWALWKESLVGAAFYCMYILCSRLTKIFRKISKIVWNALSDVQLQLQLQLQHGQYEFLGFTSLTFTWKDAVLQLCA